jgi:iron complex outermembrane receptor protein
MDYYHIDFRNRIITPPYDVSAFLHPNVYGSLISSLPSDAGAEAYLQSQLAQGATLYDNIGNGATGVRYIFDERQQNAARVVQDGVDLGFRYAFDLAGNLFTADVNAAVIRRIDTQFATGSTPTNIIDTYGNPLKRRARGSLTWMRGEWQATGAVNYSGGYTDTAIFPTEGIGSWTTFDANIHYSPSRLNGFSVFLSALNVFNREPPFAATIGLFPGINYDVANANPLGRFISLEVRQRW